MNKVIIQIMLGLWAGGSYAADSGTITFADQDGQPDNAALPSSEYNSGLPTGVTATWSGWRLHTRHNVTPMSVFPTDTGTIVFSEPVFVPSLDVMDTAWGDPFSVLGFRSGIQVWHYDGTAEGSWQTVTSGAGIEIDTLVVDGKWNHVDNIAVELSSNVEIITTSLSLENFNTGSNEVGVSWIGTAGETHQLQYTDSLTDPVWQNTGSEEFGIGASNAQTVELGSGKSRYYRVQVVKALPLDEVSAEVGVYVNGLPTPPAGYDWAPVPDYTDEFNGAALDTTKWQPRHPYWNGREPSRHLESNVSVGNGKLQLKNSVITDPSNVGDPRYDVWVGAACVTSKDQSAFYGYYESKIKASSVCMTSAFWFQSKGSYGIEIDVVEQMGVSYTHPYKEYEMQMNTHYVLNNNWDADITSPTHWTMPTRAREEYHVYGVWWKDANTLWMYHNGQKVAEMTPGGNFDITQYLFFDTEVFRWEGLPTVANLNDDSKNTMYVDWVRGWELVPE